MLMLFLKVLAKRKRVKYCERVKLRKLEKSVKQEEQEQEGPHGLLKTETMFPYSV